MGSSALNDLDSLERLSLGGLEQTLLLRGSPRNPVLLFLHGGPGVSEMSLSPYMRALERHFLVVHWDQRGAGRSFLPGMSRDVMTLDHLITDTKDLAEMLQGRFQQEKLLLVGHSWGSALGALTAQRYPELFHALVGVGPLVHGQENETRFYNYVLERAQQLKRMATLRRLHLLGEPDAAANSFLMRWWWLYRMGNLFYQSRDLATALWTGLRFYAPREVPRYFQALFFSLESLWSTKLRINLFESAASLQVPLYLFAGRHDVVTPTDLAQAYFHEVDAPEKELVWFERSAHCPHLEEPARFAEVLAERVLRRSVFV